MHPLLLRQAQVRAPCRAGALQRQRVTSVSYDLEVLEPRALEQNDPGKTLQNETNASWTLEAWCDPPRQAL